MGSVVLGVLLLNAIMAAVGYCLLAPGLRGLPPLSWTTYAGVALLVGAGFIGVVLCGLAAAGAPTGVLLFLAVAAALVVGGLLCAALLPARVRARMRFPTGAGASSNAPSTLSAAVSAGAGFGVLLVVAGCVLAAFRSSPWLDDSWTFWLPKGLLVVERGLEPELFTRNDAYVMFVSPDYPLWWSIVSGLDMRFVGEVDLRAMNAQLGLLVAAFAAATARLLWGRVRPWILWPAVLLVLASPELLRQTQSGGADVPLALYLSLAVLTSACWVAWREGALLGLAFVFAAAALSTKNEAAPQLLVFLIVPSLLAWTPLGGRRLLPLYAMVGAAFLTTVPWHLWRARHGVGGDISLTVAVDPRHLAAQAERAAPAARELLMHVTQPREWLVIIPAFLATCALGLVIERRPVWLVPVLGLAAALAFWVWVYWAGPLDLEFWLSTSSYRVIDPLLLTAGVTLPLLAERLLQTARRPHERHAVTRASTSS